MSRPFSIMARLRSFSHAFSGVIDLLRSEHNARIHFFVTIVVVFVACWVSIERWEWAILVLAIGGVWMAEALNTAVEHLANLLHPEFHPLIKRAKDVAAAAVFLFSVTAAIVAAIVFHPYFFL